MIETVMTQFDGRAFVPEQQVNLPKGKKVAVTYESAEAPESWIDDDSPEPLTEDELRAWHDAFDMSIKTDFDDLSLDDLMRHIRGRP